MFRKPAFSRLMFLFAMASILAGADSALAQDPPSCGTGHNYASAGTGLDITTVPNDDSGFAIVVIDGQGARSLYVQMTETPETDAENVPSNLNMKSKNGKNLNCFKQPFDGCAVYQCNIAYQNLRTGEILPAQ